MSRPRLSTRSSHPLTLFSPPSFPRRWLYIIEGLVTVVFGLSVFFMLADSPEVARYLTAEDKELMAIRYRQAAIYNGTQHFEWSKLKAALTDYKLYLNASGQLCANVASFGCVSSRPAPCPFPADRLADKLSCHPRIAASRPSCRVSLIPSALRSAATTTH